MRLLIIDQCSGSKNIPNGADPFDVAAIDAHGREALLERDGVPAIPAKHLYTGRQQAYIDSAVDVLRAAGDTVDRLFVSAGFGLVAEETELPPYNVTFAEMDASDIDERAASLGIPVAVREALQTTPAYDVVFFALGSDYYHACDIESAFENVPAETLCVVFNQEEVASAHDNVVSIPARTAEAKEHSTIVVALKGDYLQNFAEHRSNGVSIESLDDLVKYTTTDPTTQMDLDAYE